MTIMDILDIIADENFGISSDVFKREVKELAARTPMAGEITLWETKTTKEINPENGDEYISDVQHIIGIKNEFTQQVEVISIHAYFDVDDDGMDSLNLEVSRFEGDQFLPSDFYNELGNTAVDYLQDKVPTNDVEYVYDL